MALVISIAKTFKWLIIIKHSVKMLICDVIISLLSLIIVFNLVKTTFELQTKIWTHFDPKTKILSLENQNRDKLRHIWDL